MATLTCVRYEMFQFDYVDCVLLSITSSNDLVFFCRQTDTQTHRQTYRHEGIALWACKHGVTTLSHLSRGVLKPCNKTCMGEATFAVSTILEDHNHSHERLWAQDYIRG